MAAKWPDANQPATQTGFAKLVGISQQAVSKLKANGVIKNGGTYSQWLIAYVDRLRMEAGGRDQNDRLSAARIRDTEVSANLKELEYFKECKKIVLRDDLEPLLDGLVSAVQFNVMAARDQIIEGIESKHSVTLDDESVSEPLRNALASVADSASEFTNNLEEGAEEPEAE